MKSPKVKFRIETVTPEWAAKQLAFTERAIADGKFLQRPISEPKSQSYARDMVNGHWVPNSQGIALSREGFILDGRHRLRAVVIAGVSVQMSISTGWPSEYQNGVTIRTMDTIDRNRVRGIGQQLMIDGYANGNHWAAIARALAMLATQNPEITITTLQTRTIIEKFYRTNIKEIFSLTTNSKQKRAYVCAPFSMLHAANGCAASEFAGKFFTLENLPSGSPVLALNRWIQNHERAGNNRLVTMKVVASCLYHFVNGNKLTKVYPNNEAMEWLLAQQKTNVRKICELLGAAPGVTNAAVTQPAQVRPRATTDQIIQARA